MPVTAPFAAGLGTFLGKSSAALSITGSAAFAPRFTVLATFWIPFAPSLPFCAQGRAAVRAHVALVAPLADARLGSLAALPATAVAMARLEAQRRALALYRRCLREALRWPNGEEEGAELALKAQQMFRENRDISDPNEADRLIEEGERRLEVLLHHGKLEERVASRPLSGGGGEGPGSEVPENLSQRPSIEGHDMPSDAERGLSQYRFPPNPRLASARQRARQKRSRAFPEQERE